MDCFRKHFIIGMVLTGVLMTGVIGYADEDIKVTVDGNPITFKTPPKIVEDRTMVQMRPIFEALGAKLDWDDSAKKITATKNNIEIVLQIGNKTAKINNKDKILEVAPIIEDGNTLVPLRFVSEGMGVVVRWNAETKTAIIDTKVKHGTLYLKDGTKYIGDYLDNLPNGVGKLYYSDKSDAESQNGDYVKKSNEILQDNANVVDEDTTTKSKIIYEGEFKNGLPDGEGKKYLTDGSIYEGGFKNGEFFGLGNINKLVDGNVQLVENGKYDKKLLVGFRYAYTTDKEKPVLFMEADVNIPDSLNGYIKHFYTTGAIKKYIEYKDGIATDNSILYSLNGDIMKKGNDVLNITEPEITKLNEQAMAGNLPIIK